ncbi:AAA domain-containing protein [Dictyobacter vulcani]|uniref:AAA domain-containing protein n=1 Tax=Dictyobacter vulcani TaxID=2607529 RepID=UPI00138767E7|nr:AAA domain-containing protein [Dictyobacter vulcani]
MSNTKDDCVTITVTQRLPERTLSCAHLVIERAHLLRKMKDVLVQFHASPGLGLKLFGYRECIEETVASSLLDTISDVFVPDDAQHLAIQRALGSEVQLILGPGGTGKTDVLAAIAMLHAVLYKRRVLIASHTNIAIDNAMIRLAAFFRKQGMGCFLDKQNLVRAGSPHLAELETDAYRHVTLSSIVNDEIALQREEIARIERRREEVLSAIATYQEAFPGHARA